MQIGTMQNRHRHKNQKEETNMSTYMKKLGRLASAAAMALGLLALGNTVHAVDANPGNDSAAMIVRITPNADRGVTISSGDLGGAQISLGLVDLGASTRTIHPATVTVQGNMINTELDLAASISGGWVFDPIQSFTSTGGANQLATWVQFTSVSTGLAPAQDYEYFRVGTTSGSKIIATGASYSGSVGLTGSTGVGFFENNEGSVDGGPGNLDMMAPAAVRHMFTYFTLPTQTSITVPQDINFVLSVRAGS